MNNKRVLIIGSPGSGKSTLARKLNQKWGLPLIHLDAIYHEAKHWSTNQITKKAEWRVYINNLCETEGWFMDGNYTSTLDIRIPNANLVIFLDYPRGLALFRVIKRRIIYRKITRPDMPQNWDEKMSLDLLKKIWNFKKTHKSRIEQLLVNIGAESVVILRSPVQAQCYLRLQ